MILILSQNQPLITDLIKELAKSKLRAKSVDLNAPNFLESLYQTNVMAVVSDYELPGVSSGILTDLLNSLGKRIPIVVLRAESSKPTKKMGLELSDVVTIVENAHVTEIMATLEACGVLGSTKRRSWQRSIAYFNPLVPTRMLIKNGGVGILTIDASAFRKIEIEYGSEVYSKVKEVFQKILTEMWGRPGCFRASDVLCRRSDHGNTYYVFLNRSRTTGSLPLPGVLESIADRIGRIIQNQLWTELMAKPAQRRLPKCIKTMPTVVVGFASAMYNPCLDPAEVINSALESSTSVAKIQMTRMKDRHREMMMTLIQADELLYPNFQAVFKLPDISKEMVETVRKDGSIKPIVNHIYGFEALVRVRADQVRAFMGQSRAIMDPKFMRPDVLFSIAKATKVALELDQACLNNAIAYAEALPGYLMVNILPRNFNFVSYLKNLLKERGNVILEVSESEAINNLDLMNVIQAELGPEHVQIAADDFGKAFTGLDRVIKMKPQMIKFDRSLIEDIHEDSVKHAYVSGLVKAARLLNTLVLAEGVEKWEELECLQKMGIDFVQGFLLHRPQPVETVLEQLDAETENSRLNTVA